MRAIQHKCLLHLACMTPTRLLFLKNVVNSKNDSKIEKSFPLVSRACQFESIDII